MCFLGLTAPSYGRQNQWDSPEVRLEFIVIVIFLPKGAPEFVCRKKCNEQQVWRSRDRCDLPLIADIWHSLQAARGTECFLNIWKRDVCDKAAKRNIPTHLASYLQVVMQISEHVKSSHIPISGDVDGFVVIYLGGSSFSNRQNYVVEFNK